MTSDASRNEEVRVPSPALTGGGRFCVEDITGRLTGPDLQRGTSDSFLMELKIHRGLPLLPPGCGKQLRPCLAGAHSPVKGTVVLESLPKECAVFFSPPTDSWPTHTSGNFSVTSPW